MTTTPVHSAIIELGSYSWTSTPSDKPAIGQPSSVSINWKTPDSEPVYSTHEPWTATVVLHLEHIADIAGLKIGDAARIVAWQAAPGATLPAGVWYGMERPPLAVFLGAIADLEFESVKWPHGTLTGPSKYVHRVTVTLVDATARLAELPVGTVAYPAEFSSDRLARIAAEAGINWPVGVPGVSVALAARPAETTDARSLLISTLRDVAGFDGTRVELLVINTMYTYPNTGDGTVQDPDEPFTAVGYYKLNNNGSGTNPDGFELHLVNTSAGLDVTPTARPDGTFWSGPSACTVPDESVKWAIRKAQAIDQVVLEPTDGSTPVTYSLTGPVPTTYRTPTELSDPADRALLGSVLLSDTGSVPADWALDEATKVTDAAADVVGWFAPLGSNFFRSWLFYTGVVVRDIDPDQSPTRRTWWAGQVSGGTFTLSRGTWTASLSFRPVVPRPAPAGTPARPGLTDYPYLSCENLAASAFGTKRPIDCAPDLTPYDLRLVRRPD